MIQKKILLADDDPEIREVVRLMLSREGYEVTEAVNGIQAVEKASGSVDLIILDVMMPEMDGISACETIRQTSTVPILFLTAKSQDMDKETGFEAGGDDYLVKPFSMVELAARVKAMLRRSYVYQSQETASDDMVIRLPGLSIHTGLNEVIKNGQRLLLTDLEYQILVLLAQNRKRTYTSQELYETIWKEAYLYTSNNTVMVHIRNLRKKLEDDPQNPRYIKNVWGKGYRIE